MADIASPTELRIAYREAERGSTEVSLELDGRSVSRAYIIPMAIRIGAATVRMDGIGGVGTEEGFRNRGYSRLVLEAAVRRMREGDAALSTLYGIPDYYPRFGYASAGPEHEIRLLDATRPTALPPGWEARPVRPGDLPHLRRIYDEGTARSVGAVLRPASTWNHLLEEGGPEECRVVAGPGGEIAAYAVRGRGWWWMNAWRGREPDAFLLAEAMARDGRSAEALLAACRAWADQEPLEGGRPRPVYMALPPEGPVALAAMMEDALFAGRYYRCANFMARTLDTGRLLRALAPELSARLRASRSSFAGTLRIRTDEGEGALAVGPDGVVAGEAGAGGREGTELRVELHQSDLARLALGGYPPEGLLARLPSPPDEEAARLLTTLFPLRHPHVYPLDRF